MLDNYKINNKEPLSFLGLYFLFSSSFHGFKGIAHAYVYGLMPVSFWPINKQKKNNIQEIIYGKNKYTEK